MKKLITRLIITMILNSTFLTTFSQASAFMDTVYGTLRNLWSREDVWGIQETSSDECAFPTRGTDWQNRISDLGGRW